MRMTIGGGEEEEGINCFFERAEEGFLHLLSGEPLGRCTQRVPPKGKHKNPEV